MNDQFQWWQVPIPATAVTRATRRAALLMLHVACRRLRLRRRPEVSWFRNVLQDDDGPEYESPGLSVRMGPPPGPAVPADTMYNGTSKRPIMPGWPATMWLNHAMTPTRAAELVAHEARHAWQYEHWVVWRWLDEAILERDAEAFAKTMRRVAKRLGRAAEHQEARRVALAALCASFNARLDELLARANMTSPRRTP